MGILVITMPARSALTVIGGKLMATDKSYVIVDCEQSFMSYPSPSYPFSTYLPLFAQVAQKDKAISPIANLFYQQYRKEKLTVETIYCFLKVYQEDLYAEILYNISPDTLIKSNDRKYLRPDALIELKDKALRQKIIELYAKLGEPIIIVTANPHVNFITECLHYFLPQECFTVKYAPPLDNIKEPMSNKITPLTITLNTELPPPEYSLIFNPTQPIPEGGWENYAAELELRLLKTGDYCDLREEKEQRELKEKSVTVTSIIQENRLIYSGEERSLSPNFFKKNIAGEVSNTQNQIKGAQSPIVRRIISDAIICLSSSLSSPLSSPSSSPLRPASPALSPVPPKRALRAS